MDRYKVAGFNTNKLVFSANSKGGTWRTKSLLGDHTMPLNLDIAISFKLNLESKNASYFVDSTKLANVL